MGDGNTAFTWPEDITAPTTYNTYVSNWNGAPSYSADQWATLETAGCVFLPAAGRRNGTSVGDAALGGYYWSSTPDAMPVVGAYYLLFYDSNILQHGNWRYFGHSVRLVQDAN